MMEAIFEFFAEMIVAILFDNAIIATIVTFLGVGIAVYSFWPFGAEGGDYTKIVGVPPIIIGVALFYRSWKIGRDAQIHVRR